MRMSLDAIKAIMFGHALGDVLEGSGEFSPRAELSVNPVAGMRWGGTYDVPAGSWSDDTSMPFCLLESIAHLKRRRQRLAG